MANGRYEFNRIECKGHEENIYDNTQPNKFGEMS